MSMTRSEILAAAERCVCGDRETDYGGPERNFARIAEFWTTYLRDKAVPPGVDLCILPEDVAAMLALLKIARIASGHAKADNWIDLAGYAACGGEIEGVKQTAQAVTHELFVGINDILALPNCINCAHAGGACKYEPTPGNRYNCPLHKPEED
jgi:hypothetical protein